MALKPDWQIFINELLDKRYALDIKKTGSVSAFVKNQLGACENPYTETHNFKAGLEIQIERTPFIATQALKDPGVYKLLMELGFHFHPTLEMFIAKCASLYTQLTTHKATAASAGNIFELKVVSSKCIVNFIANWKLEYENIGIRNIYDKFNFLQAVAEKWKLRLLSGKQLNNPNVLIGIIYLNEWSSLPATKKEQFFADNADNEELFGSILGDMERLEGQIIFNYSSFAEDCHTYFQEFYAFIEQRCKSWIAPPQQTELVAQKNEAKVIQFNSWAEKLAGDLGGGVLRQNVDLAMSAN